MLGLLISPFSKIIGVIVLVGALFGAGYYKGYSAEKERFDAFKTELAAQAKAQELINESTKKQQSIISKSIRSEYEAKLSSLKSYYNWVYNNSSSSNLPSVSNTSSSFNGETSKLLLDCSYSTQQLISLQDWIIEISKTN